VGSLNHPVLLCGTLGRLCVRTQIRWRSPPPTDKPVQRASALFTRYPKALHGRVPLGVNCLTAGVKTPDLKVGKGTKGLPAPWPTEQRVLPGT